MALRVHRSAAGADLVLALSRVLGETGADPFAADIVAVPERGVERWLSQRLSHQLGAGGTGDGVSANLSFPSPAALLDGVLAEASPEHAAAVGLWAPEAVVWPLVDLIDALPGDEIFTPLRHYLDRPNRRYALADKIAALFHSYGQERPELIQGWAEGGDEAAEDLAWQPQLWRRLRGRLGPSPAELHGAAIAALRAGDMLIQGRICIYGLNRLTRARLDILAALAERQDVHLFVNHPGQSLWDAVGTGTGTGRGTGKGTGSGSGTGTGTGRGTGKGTGSGSGTGTDSGTGTGSGTGRRRDDTGAENLSHPLLSSLSRDVRELQQRLATAIPGMRTQAYDKPSSADTLLGRLQRDLREDHLPGSREPIEETDRSLQIHACHGSARQVEVLREVVLRILADDPTLEPRDVLVMCPDVEHYAPLIKATFDTDSHPGGRLRVSIADRSRRQTNPLLDLATRLLELAESRLTGPQVLDLAGHQAVRRQFGFTDDDLEQLRAWTIAAHVRWGMDGETRAGWGLGGLEDGTWRSGLDRLLTGIALGGARTAYGGVLPVGGIDSTDIDLVGRFAELLDRLDAALTALSGSAPVAAWLVTLREAVLRLGDTTRDGAWQVAQLGREFAATSEAAADNNAELTLTDIKVLLDRQLRGRPTRSSFRTGALTVATLTPMRSVPHRVVCLLGLDDTAFPRHGLPDGDDLLGRDPLIGERDARSEDRQLFLDAILAARDHLVITYSGADVRTGVALPPAVPVGELLDALDLTAENAREHVVTRHTLQPFDARNFSGNRPFSFDRGAFDGALSLRGPRLPKPGFLAEPLDPMPPGPVTLRELREFLENPTKAFLRSRLEVSESTRDEQPIEAISLELDGLEEWGVADRVLRARMGGLTPDAAAAAEVARGWLPPGSIGAGKLATINERVTRLALAAAPFWRPRESVEINVDLGAGRSLTGAVSCREDTVLHVGYSTLRPKHRLSAWIDLLALTAERDGGWRAAVVGRRRDDAVLETYGPVTQRQARDALRLLVSLREIGLRTPFPLPVDVAAAYAEARHRNRDYESARKEAAGEWRSTFTWDKADRAPENVLVWGPEQPFDLLSSWVSPLPPGIPPVGEVSDFGRLACNIWLPLLDARTLARA